MPSRREGRLARLVLAGLAAPLAACLGDDPCATESCRDHAAVARSITVATEKDGVTLGFDLDGRVSDSRDVESCGRPDFVSPDGVPGIDNQMAILWTALEDVIGDAAEGLVRDAIHDGKLLFMIELLGIDDPADDDCVGVEVFLGDGAPLIGTDGTMLPGQTFAVAADSPVGRAAGCAPMRDGVVTSGAFDVSLPVRVLDVEFDLELVGARLQARLAEDGSLSVTLGAGVPIAPLIDAVVAGVRDEGPAALIIQLLRNLADLDRDPFGDCQQISTTLLLDMAHAYRYRP